ncbi:MAG TPA: CHAT domain-containing protein [Acidimicrobiia bacterium]|nr:CHAT domain-containing protein [Acidimicrobiia bacterium]
MELQDFEISIRRTAGAEFVVSVDRSPGGETSRRMTLPFDGLALENRLQRLQIALLSGGTARRRIGSDGEKVVRDFGQSLFNALIADNVRNVFDVSRARAAAQGQGLRIKLSCNDALAAGLPWEYMFDERSDDFVGLSQETPIVRYLRVGQPPRPLALVHPLRILGLVASPADRVALDTTAEKQRLEPALGDLCSAGRIELHWAAGESWRELQHELRHGPWHIFHFVGHGGFDSRAQEGVLALVADDGTSELISATNVGRLLGDHQSIRLAVLNCCEGARANDADIFSSVASVLVRRGTPAVLGMQYEITDDAAIEVAQAFYAAIADGSPVDLALTDARKAVCLAMPTSLEWGVPVLYTHTNDGVLFDLAHETSVPDRSTGPREAPVDPKTTSETIVTAADPATPTTRDSTARSTSTRRRPPHPWSPPKDSSPTQQRSPGLRLGAVAVFAAVILTVALLVVRPWDSPSRRPGSTGKAPDTQQFGGYTVAKTTAATTTVDIHDQQLDIAYSPVPGATVPAVARGVVTTRCRLHGNFDIRVSYLVRQSSLGAQFGLLAAHSAAERIDRDSSPAYVADFGGQTTETDTSDLEGSLRLVRHGSTIAAYARPVAATSWGEPLRGPSPIPPQGDEDTSITLQLWGTPPTATRVSFTNLSVVEGHCT